MTSYRLLLSFAVMFFIGNTAFAGLAMPPERLREMREEKQRQREERDRERRERTNPRQPQPAPRPAPVPLPGGPPDIYIENTQYAGRGCPAGSVALVKSPDSKALSVLFDEFIFDAGSGARGNSNCQLQIPIRIANGKYRLKILAVDLRGFVQINDPGVRGTIRARSQLISPVAIPRLPKPYAVDRQNFTGPVSEPIFIHLDGDEDSRIFTGCTDRATLNVTAEIALSGRNRLPPKDGLIAIDSIDQDVQHGGLTYQLGWEPCR